MSELNTLGDFRKRQQGESLGDYFKNALTKLAKTMGYSTYGNEAQRLISAILQKSKDAGFLSACYEAVRSLMPRMKRVPDPIHVFREAEAYA